MKPHEHGGQIHRWKKEFGLSDADIVDFSANINPLGPPQNVIEKIKKELDNLPNYPEPDALELCEKLSKVHLVSTGNVLAGNGASELIDLFFLYLLPKKVLLPAPTFKEYERAALAAGSEIENFYLGDKSLKSNLDGFIRKIKDSSPEVVVICTPNNPTGEILETEDIMKIADAVKGVNGWLLIDKSFIAFARENWQLMEWDDIPENIAIIYSFTKMYAIAAIRLGYLIGDEKLIKALKSFRNPWNVNYLAQVAGKVCLLEKDYERKTRELVSKEREKLLRNLQRLNFTPYPGRANYILVKINNEIVDKTEKEHKLNSEILWKGLAQKGIFIRNAVNFNGLDDKYFRIAVRLPWENDSFLYLLETFLREQNYIK